MARMMGVPIIGHAATNSNDALCSFINSPSGAFKRKEELRTLAPAMDIQVAYNMERLIALLRYQAPAPTPSPLSTGSSSSSGSSSGSSSSSSGGGGVRLGRAMGPVAAAPFDAGAFMDAVRTTGFVTLSSSSSSGGGGGGGSGGGAEGLFAGIGVYGGVAGSDEVILRTIADTYRSSGYLPDPHTAVAINSALHTQPTPTPDADADADAGVVVVMSSAHCAKFPSIVRKALVRELEQGQELEQILASQNPGHTHVDALLALTRSHSSGSGSGSGSGSEGHGEEESQPWVPPPNIPFWKKVLPAQEGAEAVAEEEEEEEEWSGRLKRMIRTLV